MCGIIIKAHTATRGCSSMAELQLPKLIMRVRFPSFAPSEHKNRASEIRRPQTVDKPQTTRAIRPGFSHVESIKSIEISTIKPHFMV